MNKKIQLLEQKKQLYLFLKNYLLNNQDQIKDKEVQDIKVKKLILKKTFRGKDLIVK